MAANSWFERQLVENDAATGTQASAITDATAITGGEAPTEAEHNALVTKINSIIAALEAFGITAS